MIFTLFCTLSAASQPRQQHYLDYIDRYKSVALQHEKEYGVPASITLAQGILESSVGRSKMAVEANNHFGIKAYHWNGEVYGGNDSIGIVGYRKYGLPEDSFLDHAKFLTGPRYKVLYKLDVTDYRSWAQGLRDCGYAEDVNYPAKLINIIEQYELYSLNGGSRQDGNTVLKQAPVEPEDSGSDRWHHRKHRNRSQNEATVTQEQERPAAPVSPVRPGRVLASADNE